MEIALVPEMPTYSGGLGVLAGDMIRSAGDMGVPMVAVTLLYRKGYFYQRLDSTGMQQEEPVEWVVEDFLTEMPPKVSVSLEGRRVWLRAWKYEVKGLGGFSVPVYFLDSDLPENSEPDRALTHFLYGGDQRYRLCQEALLGIGGVRMLRSLGYNDIVRFHMNEGHSSLLITELLNEQAGNAGRQSVTYDDIAAVRGKCVFTTHTPVAAAHDQFPVDLVGALLGDTQLLSELKNLACFGDVFNATFLALNLSRYVNGVAKKHKEVARLLFAGYPVDSITNGVHAATWVVRPLQELFDRHIRGWRHDNLSLRYVRCIPEREVWEAHLEAKKQLLHYVNAQTNVGMDVNIFTIGFARRATAYKRVDLLFTDLSRLRRIALETGRLQIILAGKAHPHDQPGKDLIRRVFRAKEELGKDIKVVYLPNYDIECSKMMVSGVDLWLNTPQPPMEASGTSGMKAALNGVPSLSVLDGWWIEGHIEGVTGWAIGENSEEGLEQDGNTHAESLYEKLEQVILPTFYRDHGRFVETMRYCIAINGSFFNTQRMVREYLLQAYA
ncbi:MAG: alpha-glucan family phosphorylase [Deltaproteobacteria bacterium]|nr:alpha-glucan family phosphorylase [Deltaproteobacteria bacterium]